MEHDLCHICGMRYEGTVCPACSTPRASAESTTLSEAEAPKKLPSVRKQRVKTKVRIAPSAFAAVTKVIRRSLWCMILFALCVCLLYARRNLASQETFIGNLEQFAQTRAATDYIWEKPELYDRFSSIHNLITNFPQFLQLAEDHFFNAIEEVGTIWSTH